ncbi:MAG: hypothetical protein JST85_13640 [Acidobacteria bacterium]|nr:hypothetical protein [Acidobacteriota bacterium]
MPVEEHNMDRRWWPKYVARQQPSTTRRAEASFALFLQARKSSKSSLPGASPTIVVGADLGSLNARQITRVEQQVAKSSVGFPMLPEETLARIASIFVHQFKESSYAGSGQNNMHQQRRFHYEVQGGMEQ